MVSLAYRVSSRTSEFKDYREKPCLELKRQKRKEKWINSIGVLAVIFSRAGRLENSRRY